MQLHNFPICLKLKAYIDNERFDVCNVKFYAIFFSLCQMKCENWKALDVDSDEFYKIESVFVKDGLFFLFTIQQEKGKLIKRLWRVR